MKNEMIKIIYVRIGETVAASTTRNDAVAESGLDGSILMEDGLPVGLDGANTARNHLVKESNDGFLRKVFSLVCRKVC